MDDFFKMVKLNGVSYIVFAIIDILDKFFQNILDLNFSLLCVFLIYILCDDIFFNAKKWLLNRKIILKFLYIE